MKIETIWRKAAAAATVLGLAVLLAGCILAPGKFVSTLDLRKNGTFTFTYKGEIYLLGIKELANMADEAGKTPEFMASPCFDIEDDYAERECTEEELAQQQTDWDAQQVASKEEDERTSKAMGSMFGGIDPSDPQAAEELAAKLRRQHGWNSVTYKGNGLYEVDFSVTSKATHDFMFPVMEGFPIANFFVVANMRDGNAMKIEAPGFAVQSSSAGAGGGMMQMATIFGAGDAAKEQAEGPMLDGTFTITTDGAILANNTDEGPKPVAGGQKLEWIVTKRTTEAPGALIQLGT